MDIILDFQLRINVKLAKFVVKTVTRMAVSGLDKIFRLLLGFMVL